VSGRRTVAIVALAALAACRKTDGAAAPGAPLATPLSLLPAETVLVASVDLARLRKTPLVAKLAAASPLPPSLVQAVETFTGRSGIDPWRTFDSVVVAVAANGKAALLARGPQLDQARLEAAAREALPDGGGDLVTESRGRWTLWSPRGRPGLEAVLLDHRTLIVATGGWATQIAAQATGGTSAASAASNAALAKLCQGVADHPIWAAAIVSAPLRELWMDNLQTQEISVLDQVAVGVDVDAGLEGKLTATLTDGAQADKWAEDLAQRLVHERLAGRSNPITEGLLKGVTTYADGSAVHVDASLGEAELVPWAQRLSRYWRFVGAKLPAPSQRALPLKMVPADASSASGAIALGEARIFTDFENNRYAIVEVSNRSSRPVVPALQLVYRRRSGDMIAPGHCTVQVGILQPREKSVCVGQAPGGATSANYDVHLLAEAQAAETRTALKVLGAHLGPALGPVQWVAGRVRNESRAELERPQVLVSFYDAGGKLVGYGREDFDGKPLLPGAEAPFLASSLIIMSGVATSFTVTAFSLGDKP
jgi:hypothetical protein